MHPNNRRHCLLFTTAIPRVTGNEFWFSDKPPDLGKGFSVAKTQERSTRVIEILLRAAKKAAKNDHHDLAKALFRLLDKLEAGGRFSRGPELATL
jgi:hypothetical protein